MFYEIFFGIVAGVVFAGVATIGLFYALYRLTGGKANYEKMKRLADEQWERVERRIKER